MRESGRSRRIPAVLSSRLRHWRDVTRDPRDLERIGELEAKLAAALKRVVELEEKLGASSRNSSKPPSSDPPTVPPKAKSPTGRTRGGQPGQLGHKRHRRELFPPEKVAEVIEVADLPKIEPVVKEYRVHTLGCIRCGHATRGELPKGTPACAFGPGVVATVAVISDN